MESNESILIMSFCMILAGFFSGMNAFVNKIDDVRFNINDLYMSLMMIGLMFIFMSIFYKSKKLFLIGILVSTLTFFFLRNQIFVNSNQFFQSIIPHHSMAVMMSKQIIDKKEKLPQQMHVLVEDIIQTQENEIHFMKKYNS
jgi:hypothetical protein